MSFSGGIGGLPISPPNDGNCRCGGTPPIPPVPSDWVVFTDLCRVDINDINGVFDASTIQRVDITTNGPNSPLIFLAPFSFPVQVGGSSWSVIDPSLCEVDITSIELYTDIAGTDLIVQLTDGWHPGEYITTIDAPASCTVRIQGNQLDIFSGVRIILSDTTVLDFNTADFDVQTTTEISITDASLCGETVDEVRLYYIPFTVFFDDEQALGLVVPV